MDPGRNLDVGLGTPAPRGLAGQRPHPLCIERPATRLILIETGEMRPEPTADNRGKKRRSVGRPQANSARGGGEDLQSPVLAGRGEAAADRIPPEQVEAGRVEQVAMFQVSETTMGKTLRTLRALFNRSLKAGLLNENPLAGIRLPRQISRAKRIYSPAETRAMRAVAPSFWWRTLIALAETTGLRKQELTNLHWTDIDTTAKTVRVAIKRTGTITLQDGRAMPVLAWTPKSYEERTVPIPDATIGLLTRLKSESDGSPYVFVSLKRLGFVARVIAEKGKLGPNFELVNNLQARFDLIQEKARALIARESSVEVEKVQWAHGSMHDLRRTFGTRMARVVPMHVLKEFMGHAKITTTQEYYLAAETEDADRARDAMQAMFGSERGATQGRTGSDSGRMLDACRQKFGGFPVRHAPTKNDKPLRGRGLWKRGGRDSNPQPPDRQSGTLTN
jgi:integrase